MKFEDDFDLVSQQATCRIDNVWEKPAAWKNCVESKISVEQEELLSLRLMIRSRIFNFYVILDPNLDPLK